MSIREVLARATGAIVFGLLFAAPLMAAQDQQDAQAAQTDQSQGQSDGQSEQTHDMANMPGMQHDMSQMTHDTTMSMREGSGTAWQPDSSPMYALRGQSGPWQLMLHWNAFAQYIDEGGPRGSDQFGSINWLMGMIQRQTGKAGKGHVAFRAMVSAEPWTIQDCGYPDLLQSGEQCHGATIHDRQHPHDLFMELSVEYDRPLAGSVRWQVYGGPAAEPALGPVAFSHRVSALPNPIAPISHHWFDSTHVSFGVVTGGVYTGHWKAEASVFNGREPDEHRTDVDFGSLDSYSGRVSYLPRPSLALQVSAGELTGAEAGHEGGPRIDVARVTASAAYNRVFHSGSFWANTVGWGRDAERGGASSDAVLAETNVTIADRDAWFGRFEIMGKPGSDLDVPSSDVFTVSKLQGGYVRYLRAWRGIVPGLGGSLSAARVPSSLALVYGGRTNVGFGVFLTIRPPRHAM